MDIWDRLSVFLIIHTVFNQMGLYTQLRTGAPSCLHLNDFPSVHHVPGKLKHDVSVWQRSTNAQDSQNTFKMIASTHIYIYIINIYYLYYIHSFTCFLSRKQQFILEALLWHLPQTLGPRGCCPGGAHAGGWQEGRESQFTLGSTLDAQLNATSFFSIRGNTTEPDLACFFFLCKTSQAKKL